MKDNWIEDFSKSLKRREKFKIRTFNNFYCLKCKALFKEMVGIGSLVFCEHCFVEEFKEEDLKIDSEKCKYWLKKRYENEKI
ncbi:MAG: hypothetical protein V1663_04050 [archaeon]